MAPEGSPRLYPDAVTLVPRLVAGVVLKPIDTSPGCSVKDSFADLDLSAHGFIVVLDAQWIFRAPVLPPTGPRLGWQLITSDEDLERWAVAADLEGIICPELIRGPTVRVLGVRDEHVVTAGAIINQSGAAVGLSNVFTTAATRVSVWRDLPAAIGDVFPACRSSGMNTEARSPRPPTAGSNQSLHCGSGSSPAHSACRFACLSTSG